uniref:Riboflavin synthase n=1 Tax=Eiseniibacteriota bacterium TaxID=2212470 RepID=A0A832I203_UNCEI
MFTGIVEDIGRVAAIEERPGGRRFWVEAARATEDAAVGDSIAVNGCCLTIVALAPGRFAVEAVPETLARTTIGGWREGERVNLERSMRLDQRLGGHLVAGHVDGVGEVLAVVAEGDGRRVTFRAPAALARFIAEKGSIAVDGTSLTVARVEGDRFEVAYIPHTLAVTTAGAYTPGRRVHLEVDLVARYVARLLEAHAGAGGVA